MRNRPLDWEIFYDQIKNLVNNLFIDNVNLTNGHYDWSKGFSDLRDDNKNAALYILEKMEQTKHLIEVSKSEYEILLTYAESKKDSE